MRYQVGEGTTNATIKEEGMTGQDIETILQKKTSYLHPSYRIRRDTHLMQIHQQKYEGIRIYYQFGST